MAFGIYLHIPFCRRKCPYCDFNTYAGLDEQIPAYVEALKMELTLRFQDRTAPQITSLYFGGGTPSLLPVGQVEAILEAVDGHTRGLSEAEITFEINPGTVTRNQLRGLLRIGLNRLSVGCQSFQPALLEGLGRLHTEAESRACLTAAAEVGFENLSLDLMYGIPHQDLALWEDDLAVAAAQPIAHVSLYNLCIEEGTPFHEQQRRGQLPLPEEEVQAQQYESACRWARDQGLEAYEVANFARSGRRSEHNQLYWTHQEWLGIGAGAHGFVPQRGEPHFGRRWWNLRAPHLYTRALAEGQLPEEGSELLSQEAACDEALLLGLRTSDGWDLAAAQSRLGIDLIGRLGPAIEARVQRGQLRWSGGRVQVTEVHRITTDSIIQDLAGILDTPLESGTVSSGIGDASH